jgi:hypothetical protein
VVVPVVVSGVISPSALRNPLIHLRRRKRDREWLAATFQLLIPALRNVDARVEFGRPIYAEPGAAVGDAVIEETRRLMELGTKPASSASWVNPVLSIKAKRMGSARFARSSFEASKNS